MEEVCLVNHAIAAGSQGAVELSLHRFLRGAHTLKNFSLNSALFKQTCYYVVVENRFRDRIPMVFHRYQLIVSG